MKFLFYFIENQKNRNQFCFFKVILTFFLLQDINWKELAKQLRSRTEKLRNLVNNNVNYPPQVDDDAAPKSFRQAVQMAHRKSVRLLEDLMDGEPKHRAIISSEAEMARRKAIKDFYGDKYVWNWKYIKTIWSWIKDSFNCVSTTYIIFIQLFLLNKYCETYIWEISFLANTILYSHYLI